MAIGGAARLKARSFTPRVVAYAFGIELPFSLLVPVAHLRLLGVVDTHLQHRALALTGLAYAIKTALLVALLVRMLRPIERLRGLGGGDRFGRAPSSEPPATLLCDAAHAAYDTPIKFARVWAVSWALLHVPVTAVLSQSAPSSAAFGIQRAVAMGLFSLALFAAALPLAYSILARLLSPAAGAISLLAREHGVTLPGESYSLADRLVLLGICLAIAPTSWMASMVLTEAAGPTGPGATLTLAIFSLVAVAWAPVCASFLAGALAGPFRHVGIIIDKIIQRGDVERLERIPVHFKDEIGDLAGGVNTMVDRLEDASRRMRAYVAERERLLLDAAQRAAQLQAVLDNLVEGVFACDAQGRITLVNASGARLLGLPSARDEPGAELAPASERKLGFGPTRAEDTLGRAVTRIMTPGWMRHRDGRPFTREELPLVRALAGETIAQEQEILLHGAGGRPVFLRTSAAPIRAEGGQILGAVAVARDVTELVELDIVKEQFIRVGAHELKTPLAIVKGYANGLLRNADDLSARRRKMLEGIERGIDRINRIVDDLLATSQAALATRELSVQEVDLGRLTRETLDSFAASSHRHRFSFQVQAERPILAHADPERLRRALGIVLDNAVKYSPEGGDIDVSVSVLEPPPLPPGTESAALFAAAGSPGPSAPRPPTPAPEAVVSVRDHGVGIPAHKQGRIFERFFRAHTDTAHDYGGIGLGLYLARDMIARQGGRIWFDSEDGRGTIFHFTAPLAGQRGPRA